ncbi:hypothetical protein R3P38DRAFT_2419766, partial [Favolaschia claudopus]
ARLRLPNGQIVRSVWKESQRTDVRIARNVKFVNADDETCYGEVQFFFQVKIAKTNREHVLALISVYSEPDASVLEDSFGTVILCDYLGEEALEVIEVGQIQAGIAMIPDEEEGTYFVGEKLGLEMDEMGGAEEDMFAE